MTKICIYGAGAIGGYIAGHLARADLCEVNIIARGAVLAALHQDGLTVETPQGRFTTRPHATDDPTSLGPQDYLLFTLKGHQLDAALASAAPLIGPATAILPPTTGLPVAFLRGLDGPFADHPLAAVDPLGLQTLQMPPEQIAGIVYWIGAHATEPAIVRQDGPRASCMVGELDGTPSERAIRLSRLLSDSGIATPLRPNIRGDIWIKFVNSLCWNPVAVLTLATNGAIGQDPAAIATVRRMMAEADAVAAHLGLSISVSPDKRIAVTLSAPDHKMSMLQDFEAGRRLELETLERSIRAVRDLADLPTPTIDAALAFASLRARTAQQEIAR